MQKLSSPALKPLRFGGVLISGGRLFHKFIAAGRRLPLYTLGRIQDLTNGGSDKRPPKAVAPRWVQGHASPENF